MASAEVENGPMNHSNNFSTPGTPKESHKKLFEKERSISPSCVDYMKKKEMFLYKMMNDSSNKAMLYFLEILMQSKVPISIEDLANRLAHKSFSEDMKKACGGGSVEGLRAFFLKYPSLFNVRKDGFVTSIDLEAQGKEEEPKTGESNEERSENVYISPAFRGEKTCCSSVGEVSTSSNENNQSNSSTCCHCNSGSVNNFISVSHANIAKETEAVRFFQQRLIRREEKWVQIKSLAGHLSQANQEIRNLVGPQLEFKAFLQKHPQIFEIQGELVSLREMMPTNSKKVKIQSKTSKASTTTGPNRRPKSLIMMTPEANSCKGTAYSTKSMMQAEAEINRRYSLSSAPVTPIGKSGQVVQCISTDGLCLSMSANEYRAVMYLRKVLEKKTIMTLNQLMQYLSAKAPEAIQNIIGWTRIELEEFLSQHDIFFEIKYLFNTDTTGSLKGQSCVSTTTTTTNSSSGISSGGNNDNGSIVVSNRKFHQTVNILITTGKKTDGTNRTLTNKSGRICHVAKLWGIIDLGKHEHVFFDKSLFRYVDDLQKHFQINELLYFNAILAPKESRAKWRATQVWKECDRENLERISGPMSVQMSNEKHAKHANMKTFNTDHQEIYDMLNNGCQSSIGDDTEFEGEMDDYDLMPLDQPNSRLDGDILTSEVEDQINAILGPAKPNHRKINDYLTVTDEVWGLATEEDLSFCGTISSEISNNAQLSSSQIINLNNDGQVSSTCIHDVDQIDQVEDEEIALKPGQKVSVGCQTLATGDIMASHLFHESMSKLV